MNFCAILFAVVMLGFCKGFGQGDLLLGLAADALGWMRLVVVHTHMFGFGLACERALVQMQVAHPLAAAAAMARSFAATEFKVLALDPVGRGTVITTVGGATVLATLYGLLGCRGLSAVSAFNGIIHESHTQQRSRLVGCV